MLYSSRGSSISEEYAESRLSSLDSSGSCRKADRRGLRSRWSAVVVVGPCSSLLPKWTFLGGELPRLLTSIASDVGRSLPDERRFGGTKLPYVSSLSLVRRLPEVGDDGPACPNGPARCRAMLCRWMRQ